MYLADVGLSIYPQSHCILPINPEEVCDSFRTAEIQECVSKTRWSTALFTFWLEDDNSSGAIYTWDFRSRYHEMKKKTPPLDVLFVSYIDRNPKFPPWLAKICLLFVKPLFSASEKHEREFNHHFKQLECVMPLLLGCLSQLGLQVGMRMLRNFFNR